MNSWKARHKMAKEKANKTQEPKLESLKGKCIVTNYGGSYWDGTATYSSDFKDAKIFNVSELPEFVKEEAKVHNDPNASDYAKEYRNKIIRLDSEEGLKLLVDEMHNLDRYIEIEKPRIRDAEQGLKKLYNFDLIQEYIKWYNGMNPLIRKADEETKHNLVERVIEGEKSKPKINPEAENNENARKNLKDNLFNKRHNSN
jgi:hypothetical protein